MYMTVLYLPAPLDTPSAHLPSHRRHAWTRRRHPSTLPRSHNSTNQPVPLDTTLPAHLDTSQLAHLNTTPPATLEKTSPAQPNTPLQPLNTMAPTCINMYIYI